MKEILDGRITLLVSKEHITIEVDDMVSNTKIVKVTLTPEQFAQALSRVSYIPCKVEVSSTLDRIGKVMIIKKLSFPISKGMRYTTHTPNRKKYLEESAIKACPDGWVPDLYFGSQDSFYTKDGEDFAMTYIRQWIDKKEEEDEKND